MSLVAAAPAVKSIALANGLHLEYVEQGDPVGIPVILLHGVTDSWRSFEPMLPYLPESLRVFALSQRGHGDSDRPAAGYLFPQFAADVAAFMDAVGIDSAVIVGSSMGSSVAQRFAIDYPRRTRGLVQLAAFYSYQDPNLRAYVETEIMGLTDPIDPDFARAFQESTLTRPIPPEFLDLVVQESLKLPARVWRAAFEGFLVADHFAEVDRIGAPTLIIWGDQDAYCSRRDQEHLLAAIAGSRLQVYAGAGHATHWEDPERVAADIVAFVREVVG